MTNYFTIPKAKKIVINSPGAKRKNQKKKKEKEKKIKATKT